MSVKLYSLEIVTLYALFIQLITYVKDVTAFLSIPLVEQKIERFMEAAAVYGLQFSLCEMIQSGLNCQKHQIRSNILSHAS